MFQKEKIFIKSLFCWIIFWSFMVFFLNFFISPVYTNVANKKIKCTADNCLGNLKQAKKDGLLDDDTLTNLNLSLDQNGNLKQDQNKEKLLNHLNLISKNNLISYKISLYYYYKPSNNNNWIIFVHGISSDWTSSFLYSQFALKKKYNFVVFDSFGVDKNLKDSFGNLGSDGFGYPTFGAYEQYDINSIVNWINSKSSNPQIGIFGLSMGAATSLIYLKNFYSKENSIKFLFSDASYANTVNEMKHVLKEMFPLPWFFIVPGASLYMKLFFSYSPYDVNPSNLRNHTDLPYISFIHGTNDNFVPFSNFNKLFKDYWRINRNWSTQTLQYSSFLEYGADHANDLQWNKKNGNKFFNFLESASEVFFKN
ncbi:alpha/beta hydrolase [symbiont of Argiope bruennichi]|uniref:alpha/beta hydrolase n=1 Tax=symbiont of Argiope bruennichi TaxID=2810479 RepID=UPI003DA34D09